MGSGMLALLPGVPVHTVPGHAARGHPTPGTCSLAQAWQSRPSKYRPRPIGPRQIERNRLLALVDSPAAARLLLVHAPAGFGKSTLLIQWHQRLAARGEGVGWISVDADDNGSGRFARTLCDALAPDREHADADLFDCIHLSLAPGRSFTLFLDEVEHLVAPEALHLLEVVIQNSPEQFHVVLGSRSLPQQLVRKARFLPDATIVTAEQLAFDRDEIELFLRCRGCADLGNSQYEELARRTAGWAAALQLAAAAITEGDTPQVVIEHLAGPHAGLVRYLGDEVLARMPPRQARFLLQTSFLRELAAPLCDAVSGGSDARELLLQFEEHNLLLLQLDAGRAWYRYHPLFAECLRQHLQDELPGALPALARRASDWCLGSGLPEEAAEYALLCEDPAVYLPRLGACIEHLIGRAQFATAGRWLRTIPRRVLVSNAALLAWSAWVSLYEGDFVATEEALAELRRRAAEGMDVPPKERLGSCILDVMLLMQKQRFEEAEAITASLPGPLAPDDRHTQVRVLNLRAMLAQLRGDYRESGALAARVTALCRVDPPIWLSLVHAAHVAGLTELAKGNLAEARRLMQAPARSIASERAAGAAGGVRAHQPITSLLAAPCALTLYEIDRLDEAAELLDRHEPLLGAFFSASSRTLWYQLRARLHALDDDHGQHAATLRDGVAYARAHGIEWMATAILWEAVSEDLRRGRHESARQAAVPLLAGLELGHNSSWTTASDEVFGTCIGAIRYFAQTGATALALQLIEPRIAWDEAKGRRLRLAKLRVLQAMALSAGGQREPAHAAMDQALALGRECGLVRTFLDEGPQCAALLRELDQRAPEETGTPLDAYRRHLLHAFGLEEGLDSPVVAAAGAGGSPGTGALSARELQIIDRLALGHSNLFVSQQLFLSPNTIKWHLGQIYSKLGVRNRTQAVRAAQQQGLISLVIAEE